MGTVTQT